MAVLRHQQQTARRCGERRPPALLEAFARLVHERPPLSRDRRRGWHTEPAAAALAHAPVLRQVLAEHGAVQRRLLAREYSGAHHHRLLRRWPDLRASIPEAASRLRPEPRALPGDRPVRSFWYGLEQEAGSRARVRHRPGGAVRFAGIEASVHGLRAEGPAETSAAREQH